MEDTNLILQAIDTQAKAQESFNKQQARVLSLVVAKLETVEAKLDRIDRNIITIGEVVISEFNKMHPDDKRAIETAGGDAMKTPEVIEQIEGILTDKPVSVIVNGTRKNKKYATTSASQAFYASFGVIEKSEYRKESGKFIARLMRQLTGVDFNGAYPISFSPFIALAGYFYQDNYAQPVRQKQTSKKELIMK